MWSCLRRRRPAMSCAPPNNSTRRPLRSCPGKSQGNGMSMCSDRCTLRRRAEIGRRLPDLHVVSAPSTAAVQTGTRSMLVRTALAVAVLSVLAPMLDVRVTTAADEPPPPLLSTNEMSDLGWTLAACNLSATGNGCAYVNEDGAALNVLVSPLAAIDDLGSTIDLSAKLSCGGGSLLDVSTRADTVRCEVTTPGLGTETYVIFGNDSWLFTIIGVTDLEPTSDEIDALLSLRDAQIEAAGGERANDDHADAKDASALDRFLPDTVPKGLYPPQGITSNLPTLTSPTEGDISTAPSVYDFLAKR